MRIRGQFVLFLSLSIAGMVLAGCSKSESPDKPIEHVEQQETAEEPVISELTLASNGATQYSIVIAEEASPSIVYAAAELKRFLGEITGATFEILPDSSPVTDHEIILGNNTHLETLGLAVDFAALGKEGYVIQTAGTRLIIAGSDLRGTLYGVYGLLEDHFGCKWFTPEVSHIPAQPELRLASLTETTIPELEYREPFVFDGFDGDWCARNRMNSSTGRLEEKHGGKIRFGAGMFVHTFNALVPPAQYFDTHPEYFSLVDGERLNGQTQLCTTNEEVVQLCIENVKKAIKADPDAFVYSVSQNDWHNYCECDKCTALADEEGTWMAPVLYLVNRVAEAIETEFPDKAIETLAYQYTRKAPKTMRPRDNVIIRLCSIECCFMHPLDGCDSKENIEFAADTREWAKISNRLWVWDYVTSFGHYLTPFPNLRVRDDNIRFFIENNVVGIFEQDAYQCANGEFSALSGYLNAKLLWDKNYSEDNAINEFLDGVYGAAAKPIRAYIDMLHDKVRDDNIHAMIWLGPTESDFLTDEIMVKGEQLWSEALASVADQPDVLFRVRTAKLSHDYAWIEKNHNNIDIFYHVDHANFTVKPNPTYSDRIQQFFVTATKAKFTLLGEHRDTLDEYKERFAGALQESGKTFSPVEAIAVEMPKQGLQYGLYFSHDSEWEHLPAFDEITPDATGIAPQVKEEISDRPQYFALRLTGYYKAEKDGIYSFSIGSNDGSILRVAGQTVDNDGLHSTLEKNIQVALKQGYHPIEIEYFQAGGQKKLYLKAAGPDMAYEQVPASALYHVDK